jgi:hypothetical protein
LLDADDHESQPEVSPDGRELADSASTMERNYDVGPEGRFLMLGPVEEESAGPSRIVVVQNGFGELRGTFMARP